VSSNVDLGDGCTHNTVDGHDLTEDNAVPELAEDICASKTRYAPDQVLGADAGRPDAAAEDGRAGDEDAPARCVSACRAALTLEVQRTMQRRGR
jgi:hypothetical protein